MSELSALLFEENIGVVFLVRNRQVSKRIEHLDLKHHFIREYTDISKVTLLKSRRKITLLTLERRISKKLFIKYANEINNSMPTLR